MLGKHILLDISNIEDVEKIKRCEGLYDLMNEIIEEMKLNVLNYMCYDFKPYGCSMVYLLSESHMCIHTYPEHSSFSFDLYTCNKESDLKEICHIIYKYFNKSCRIVKKIVDR
jgi:S-adenosylmethionine decarboxylase proenzyme